LALSVLDLLADLDNKYLQLIELAGAVSELPTRRQQAEFLSPNFILREWIYFELAGGGSTLACMTRRKVIKETPISDPRQIENSPLPPKACISGALSRTYLRIPIPLWCPPPQVASSRAAAVSAAVLLPLRPLQQPMSSRVAILGILP
jgi:hypothetical protein